MAESPELLMIEFLSWVANRPRTYDEAMEAWQSHCPRQTIWEDAIIEGLIQINSQPHSDNAEVALTARGKAMLNGKEFTASSIPSHLRSISFNVARGAK